MKSALPFGDPYFIPMDENDVYHFFDDVPTYDKWYYKLKTFQKDKEFLKKLDKNDKGWIETIWDSLSEGITGPMYEKDFKLWFNRKKNLLPKKNKILNQIIDCVGNSIFYSGENRYDYDYENQDLKIQLYHFLLNKMNPAYHTDFKNFSVFLDANGYIHNCKKIQKLLNIK